MSEKIKHLTVAEVRDALAHCPPSARVYVRRTGPLVSVEIVVTERVSGPDPDDARLDQRVNMVGDDES